MACREFDAVVFTLAGGNPDTLVACDAVLVNVPGSLVTSKGAMFATLATLESVVPFSTLDERAEPAGLAARVLLKVCLTVETGVDTAVFEPLIDQASSLVSPVVCSAPSFAGPTDARMREYRPLMPPCKSPVNPFPSLELDADGGLVNSLNVVSASDLDAELCIWFSACFNSSLSMCDAMDRTEPRLLAERSVGGVGVPSESMFSLLPIAIAQKSSRALKKPDQRSVCATLQRTRALRMRH